MLLPLIPQEIVFKGLPVNDLILASIIFVYIINLVVSKKGREDFTEGIVDFFTDKLSIYL